MGTFSLWHWLIVLAVALLLFGGRGKIKNIMGDIGQGVTAFKKGLKEPEKVEEESEETANDPKAIDRDKADSAASTSMGKDKAANG